VDESRIWAPPPRTSLPEFVAMRFLEAMRSGALTPGERIIEATLAKRLGVSRGPLREALKALEAERLVERRAGRGMFVAEVSIDRVLQMILMRATLEGLAARLVAGRYTPDIGAPLIEQHRLIEESAAAGRTAEWRDLDWRFHEMVCEASGNEYLLRSWVSISNLVRLFLHHHPAYERRPEDLLRNHERFLASLRSGDPDLAEATFRDVIIESGYGRLGVPLPKAMARKPARPGRPVPGRHMKEQRDE
jgi:DNA-binding GntR family transcriptional regulator